MSETDEVDGVVRAILECQECHEASEYYVASSNWGGTFDGVNCSECGESGFFRVAGDGRIKFDGVEPSDIDADGLEHVTYRAENGTFEAPETHEVAGDNVWLAPDGDIAALNGGVKLIEAVETAAVERAETERGLPTWGDVIEWFEAEANGTTTRGYNQAAEIIDYKYHIVTIRKTGHVYFYEAELGYYVLKGETYINEIINNNLGEYSNENRRREIRQRVITDNYIEREDFRPPEGKVCVENGVLDLETLEREPWSPDYYFTARIQTEWPEDGEADPWAEAWWFRALADAHDKPAEHEKILRWIGYALETWHHDLEQNLFFVGYRRSGKSTIQEAIQELFGGPPTAVNITPQQLADTQFDAGQLREASLNTVNDINSTKIENSGMLKRVFSGESMKLEDKYRDPEFGAPKAKHLFTANWLPHIVGQDEAVFRRIMIVEFLNPVAKQDRDPKYKKRLKRPDVLQAILVSAARARLRLRDNNEFPADRDATETRMVWDSWRDAHKRFLYQQFEITADPDDTVDRGAYWQAAHEFATRNGWEPKSPRSITNSLQHVPGVYTHGSDDYGGLRWKDVDAGAHVPSTFDSDDDFEAQDSYQGRLTLTQNEKIRRVRKAIEEAAGEDGLAEREAAEDEAADMGVPSESVEHIIDNMLREGELYEQESGKFRFTSD